MIGETSETNLSMGWKYHNQLDPSTHSLPGLERSNSSLMFSLSLATNCPKMDSILISVSLFILISLLIDCSLSSKADLNMNCSNGTINEGIFIWANKEPSMGGYTGLALSGALVAASSSGSR